MSSAKLLRIIFNILELLTYKTWVAWFRASRNMCGQGTDDPKSESNIKMMMYGRNSIRHDRDITSRGSGGYDD